MFCRPPCPSLFEKPLGKCRHVSPPLPLTAGLPPPGLLQTESPLMYVSLESVM